MTTERIAIQTERFWKKVNKAGRVVRDGMDECWEWIGGRTRQGYGVFCWERSTGAHRVAWLIEHGSIPDGLHVLHRCDNPSCVRVSHLFLGTKFDNARDNALKGRHPSKRLEPSQVLEIARLYKEGFGQRFVAREFGISTALARAIASGATWSYLTGLTKSPSPVRP